MAEWVNISKAAELGVALATVHTVHSERWLKVASLHLTNTTNTSKTVRVCSVPSGDAAAASNALVWDFTLDGNDFLEFGEGTMLAPGATIQASAQAAASVVLFVSGREA